MKWQEYTELFDKILAGEIQSEMYENPDFIEYVKLNKSRVNRWIKQGIILDELAGKIKNIQEKQQWILISEPWCGDAANITPFIQKLSELNPAIELDIRLRDDGSNLIDSYLTNGGKAIPKLIIRNAEGEDITTWGPRPDACQKVVRAQIDAGGDIAERKILIQKWYNEDGGKAIQEELELIFA